MTTYVEAYETVRGSLLPGGWPMAGAGERYPGDYRGRALVAVQALREYLDRTADFWALEPAPDMAAVIGRYNSIWDALYKPELAPQGTSSGGPDEEAVAAASVADATDTAELDKCDFFEPDEPVTRVLEAFETGEKGVTGPLVDVLDPAYPGPVAEPELDR